ncbi:hypothetical protein Tco_1131689 [Tanacetum coccineum]|uniref:Uncharacterized protein n=1 Tax=Tanacetum coccineum TaxID=301880 RepID=A0ABQ5J9V4_9ASTR
MIGHARNIYRRPPSFSDIGRGQWSSYTQYGNLSDEVGDVSRHQAPSIGDMARANMSLGGTNSYSCHQPAAPSWNALNRPYSPLTMNESDNVQGFARFAGANKFKGKAPLWFFDGDN